MKRAEFNLFADYFQFYLQDEGANGDLSEAWTPEAVDRLLAVMPGVIGVGTVRNMDVPVSLELHDAAPADDTSAWDQVNECSLDVPSGRIVILGCTDYLPDAARFEVSPGSYRARIYYGSLADVSADALTGNDKYRIVLWKDSPCPVRILKQRNAPNSAT